MVRRRELKYIITEEEFGRLQSVLDTIMEPDKHMAAGRYMVRSQYYDSIDDEELYANLDGLSDKHKIRLRIYSLDDAFARLECKCKSNADGVKFAIPITREEAEAMAQRRYGFLLERLEEAAHRLYIKMTSHIYCPKAIVEYERTAYRYPAGDVRITFDRNIRASMSLGSIYEACPSYIPLLKADKGVLEIKYSGVYPPALMSMLGMLDVSSQAYSKYSMAMTYLA